MKITKLNLWLENLSPALLSEKYRYLNSSLTVWVSFAPTVAPKTGYAAFFHENSNKPCLAAKERLGDLHGQSERELADPRVAPALT